MLPFPIVVKGNKQTLKYLKNEKCITFYAYDFFGCSECSIYNLGR